MDILYRISKRLQIFDETQCLTPFVLLLLSIAFNFFNIICGLRTQFCFIFSNEFRTSRETKAIHKQQNW